MKTYSILLNWNDNNDDGTFGTTVRAETQEEAEHLARIEMWNSYHTEDPTPEEIAATGGSVLEVTEGAIWRAAEMEAILREFVDGIKGDSAVDFTKVWPIHQKAKKLIEEIDNG